jgi:hypothetical protein
MIYGRLPQFICGAMRATYSYAASARSVPVFSVVVGLTYHIWYA